MARSFKTPVSVDGDLSTTGQLNVTASSGDEGGQIFLNKAVTNTSITTGVNIDVYQNKLRFWEAGGTNRGFYVDITGGAAGVATSLTSGSTGAMNYAQTVGTKQSAISTAGTTIVSVSITTNGYPTQVTVTGDMENNSAGGWVVLQLYRGSTAIGNPVHAESSAGSENVPYALSVIDAPAAGTYTYALKINNLAGGTFNFGESNGPVITAVELSGPKGDTGAAGTSPNAFTTIAVPSGTNPVASTSSDTLTFTAGTGISITGTASTDTISIGTNGATANGASTLVLRDASGNFSAGTITASLTGTAANATNTTITNDAATAVAVYPTWVTANTGNLPQKTTSGALSFVPSTGVLSATTFSGSGASLTNIPAANVTGTLTSTVLGNSTVYIGNTAVALNRTIGNQALTGISSVTFPGSTSGTIQLIPTAIAGTGTVLTLPATTGTLALTSQLPTVNDGALTLAVSGTGLSGSASFTANQSGATTFTVTSNASSANGASTLIARDASGSFAANVATITTVTATTISGSGAGLTNLPLANISGTMASALNLRTGSTGAGTAPVYFSNSSSPSTLLTAPAAGALEFDGLVFYSTANATTGRAISPSSYYYVSDGSYSVDHSVTATAKSIFGGAAVGLTLVAGTTYEVELNVYTGITVAGTSAPSWSHSFLLTTVSGSPTTTIYQHITTSTNTTSLATASTPSTLRNINNATVQVLAATTTGSRYAIYTVKGIIRVTGTGTVEISPAATASAVSVDYSFNANAGSFIRITPLGSGTVTNVGSAWA